MLLATLPMPNKSSMWITARGDWFTSAEVCEMLERCVGAPYTVIQIESTFGVGECYENGGILFQRMS